MRLQRDGAGAATAHIGLAREMQSFAMRHSVTELQESVARQAAAPSTQAMAEPDPLRQTFTIGGAIGQGSIMDIRANGRDRRFWRDSYHQLMQAVVAASVGAVRRLFDGVQPAVRRALCAGPAWAGIPAR